jgi:hypothetical protein
LRVIANESTKGSRAKSNASPSPWCTAMGCSLASAAAISSAIADARVGDIVLE